MKKDQYFNLEVNLLNDDNIAGMMSELDAAEALGIYVMLLLHLRTKDNYEASCTPLLLRAFARRHDLELDMLEKVLHDYNLFEVDEERQTFRAPYLDRVMQRLEEKWRMDTENGKKGGRPKKRAKCAETPATKGRKPNETQERREEEKIGITPVVNNSSNTLAGGAADAAMVVAETEEKISASGSSETSEVRTASSVPVGRGMRIRAVDEEGQQPLQPVLSLGNAGRPACRLTLVYGAGGAAFRSGTAFYRPSAADYRSVQKAYPSLRKGERLALL